MPQKSGRFAPFLSSAGRFPKTELSRVDTRSVSSNLGTSLDFPRAGPRLRSSGSFANHFGGWPCRVSTVELPLPDYDKLALGDLRHRIRSLTEENLGAALRQEREHCNRVPVLQLLEDLAGGPTPTAVDQRSAPGATQTPTEPSSSPAHSPDDNTPLRHSVYGQTPAH